MSSSSRCTYPSQVRKGKTSQHFPSEDATESLRHCQTNKTENGIRRVCFQASVRDDRTRGLRWPWVCSSCFGFSRRSQNGRTAMLQNVQCRAASRADTYTYEGTGEHPTEAIVLRSTPSALDAASPPTETLRPTDLCAERDVPDRALEQRPVVDARLRRRGRVRGRERAVHGAARREERGDLRERRRGAQAPVQVEAK
ncbi:hypothetical protein BD309DRAFT_667612 [Dichomitus squalens]|nr:hypothetical protein BD309DRAFT_667612 [Dichomitus squalens]